MAPILDLQRRLHEAGRIRIGRQVEITSGRASGKTRPERLDHFRFTSPSRRALDAVAAAHGGQVTEWKGAPVGEQWELFTEANDIPVVVPPAEMGFSQSYELWSGGGCKRRCDGVTESLTEGPCLCDAEERECKPHTRVSVMLVGVQGVGLWRLDTQGWYAAAELQGAHELAQLLATSLARSILPARLRVEARTVKRIDPKTNQPATRNFVVPVLDFDVDVAQVALGTAAAAPAIAAPANGVTPIPALPAPSLQQQLEEVDHQAPPPPRRNSPPPLPRTGVTPRPAAAVPTAPAEGGPAEEPLTPPQPAAPAGIDLNNPNNPARRRMHVAFGEVGIKDRADRLRFATAVVGRKLESSLELTAAEVPQVITALEEVKAGTRVMTFAEDGAVQLAIAEPA